jgi:hypothetical protein
VQDALISKALSCKVFSSSQKQALKGACIQLKGREIICPAGCSNEDWPASKWAAFRLPPLTLQEEFNREGVSLAGVQTPNAISSGAFIGFYAGTEASGYAAIMSQDELPPCRYTAYAMDGQLETRLHVVTV